MSFVFISYRRSDSAATARAVREALTKSLGNQSVYLDVSSNKLGEDYPQQLIDQLRKADVVLVLIGSNWLAAENESGKRRIDQESDWVRIEVSTALANAETRVVPVLLEEAKMPAGDTLPNSIASLTKRQGVRLRHDTWDADFASILGMFEPAEIHTPSRKVQKYPVEEYLLLFDRPSFKKPCIFEEGLDQLMEALDDVSAAIATGSLHSRKGRLLARITPRSFFKSKETREVLGEIQTLLGRIRCTIYELRELIFDAEGKELRWEYDDRINHMEFYIVNRIRAGVSRSYIRRAFDLMDQIDQKRNRIIEIINAHLDSSPIELIPISSKHLEKSAQMDAEGRSCDWGNFYLFRHEEIRDFLQGGE